MRAIVTLLLLSCSALGPAHSAQSPVVKLINAELKGRADSVLAVMGYMVVPDLTASTLSISGSGSEQTDFALTQFAGGFNLSAQSPLYLEGAIAASRYDPVFVASDGTAQRRLPTKWSSATATGGIGYDFRLNAYWRLRPIFNFALGYVASDLAVAAWWLERQADSELAFLDGGHMTAGGIGGAVMADFEDYTEAREIDLELRLSAIQLHTLESDSPALEGSAEAITANLWWRYRAPTGLTLMQRPLRYVLEASHSHFMGSQTDVLGFERLSSLGLGVEFDSSHYDIIVTRTRLVARYRFGNNVSGVALGIAVSF